MKYSLIILMFLLVGCAHDRPHIQTNETPFIVHKIEKYNETHNLYYSNEFTTMNMLAMWKPVILAPSGLSIGDTLKVVKQ